MINKENSAILMNAFFPSCLKDHNKSQRLQILFRLLYSVESKFVFYWKDLKTTKRISKMTKRISKVDRIHEKHTGRGPKSLTAA